MRIYHLNIDRVEGISRARGQRFITSVFYKCIGGYLNNIFFFFLWQKLTDGTFEAKKNIYLLVKRKGEGQD